MSHRGRSGIGAQPGNDTFSSLVQAICGHAQYLFQLLSTGQWPVSVWFPVFQGKAGLMNQAGCR